MFSKYDVYTTVQSMYCYPDTDVLINKLDIRDKAELKQAEEEFTAVKQMALLQEPIKGRFTKTHLFRIHRFLFEDVYPFAGHIRKEQISKGDTMFYPPDLIDRELERVFKNIHSKKLLAEQDEEKQIQNLSQTMAELNIIHPFREGNGRSTRELIRCIQNCANSNSCAAESAVQVRPKSQSNKTDKNKTERNHPFLPDETDRLTQREQLEDYFYQALEVELLLRLCPDDEDAIYQIVDLLVDTCSTKRKMLRIAGDDKPVEVVRSRLKKLNADHIRFVLGCLAENTSPVRNMKQYLLAALFNAPTTMNLYYQNKTNHDFARGSPGR